MQAFKPCEEWNNACRRLQSVQFCLIQSRYFFYWGFCLEMIIHWMLSPCESLIRCKGTLSATMVHGWQCSCYTWYCSCCIARLCLKCLYTWIWMLTGLPFSCLLVEAIVYEHFSKHWILVVARTLLIKLLDICLLSESIEHKPSIHNHHNKLTNFPSLPNCVFQYCFRCTRSSCEYLLCL